MIWLLILLAEMYVCGAVIAREAFVSFTWRWADWILVVFWPLVVPVVEAVALGFLAFEVVRGWFSAKEEENG